MIKNLITLAIVFLVGWFVYAQFWGTSEDKKRSDKLLSSAKQTFSVVVDIFKAEGEKIQNGTYDDAINNLGKVLDDLREIDRDGNYKDRITELVKQKDRLEKEVQEVKETDAVAPEKSLQPKTKPKVEGELKELTDKVDKLLKDMESNPQ